MASKVRLHEERLLGFCARSCKENILLKIVPRTGQRFTELADSRRQISKLVYEFLLIWL